MLNRLHQNRDGAVSIMVGFGILMLLGAVGVAVDVGRGQMAQTKLQNALDAAGLAAGASVNSQDLAGEVSKYMNVNFAQGTLGATITTVTPTLSTDGQLLTVTANATMPTTIMRVFGRTTMDLYAETEVTRSSKGMELAMVLDVTGSMCQPSCVGRLDALKTAANDLLDILFGEGATTADKLWVGMVPFSMGVNIGNTHTDWLDPTAVRDWGGQGWRGCTEARWTTGNDLTDATPATERFLPYYWQDDVNNNWREVDNSDTVTNSLCGPTSANNCRCTPATGGPSGGGGTRICTTTTSGGGVVTRIYCTNQTSGSSRRCYQEVTTPHAPIYTYAITSTQGPNTFCPTTPVTRLTNQRATLNSAITALTAVGGTHIPIGAAWGWRMLSPDWRGLWGGSMNTNNLPLDYDADLMIKAMILMTDGENTMYSSTGSSSYAKADGAYGYTNDNHVGMDHHAPPFNEYDNGAAAEKLDEKLGAICTSMKQRGIVVYVVVFDVDEADVASEVRGCASQADYYFNSPDGDSLRQAFRTIGDSLANLRLSR